MKELEKVREALEACNLAFVKRGDDYFDDEQVLVLKALAELKEFMERLESGKLAEEIANTIDKYLVYDKASGSRFLKEGEAAQAAINVIKED